MNTEPIEKASRADRHRYKCYFVDSLGETSDQPVHFSMMAWQRQSGGRCICYSEGDNSIYRELCSFAILRRPALIS